MPAWKVQARELRQDMGVPSRLHPWTPGRKLTGMPRSARVLECLDLACLQFLGSDRIQSGQAADLDIENETRDLFVDVSQNPIRKAFTNSAGVSKCLTTSSSLYSFHRDGTVLPLEHLMFQGHGKEVCIPTTMTQAELKELAGEGICLPCLGAIMISLLSAGCFAH